MPYVRALASFSGKYGPIRNGQTFNCDPHYASQLKRNKLITIISETQPGPSKDRAIPEAPQRGGKDDQGNGSPSAPKSTAPQPPDAGPVLTSASVQAGQASTARTLELSASGGRQGKSTPRTPKKNKTKTSSTPPDPNAA